MPARKNKADMMAFMRELIREEPNGPRKILFAFDLDDTLIKTNSSVIVRNNGKVDKLTPAEYAIYDPKPGDTFDYIEFKRIKEPEIIKATFDLFSKVLSASNKVNNAKTIILTARSPEISNDLHNFLTSKGLSGVELFAVGSSDPAAKAKVIQDFIDEGFNTIRFYDDSPKNVAAVRGLSSTNPKVDIMAKLIKESLHEARPDTEESDVIPGGMAQGKTLMDLAQKLDPKGHMYNTRLWEALARQLRKGIEVEMEHTSDPKVAREIALDHLFEDPKYYSKLLKAKLEEDIHDPVKPGILKKKLGKLSCSKVRAARGKLKDKGNHYAKALQRYLNYHCQD